LGNRTDRRGTLRIDVTAATGTIAVIRAAGASFKRLAGDAGRARKRMPRKRARGRSHLVDESGRTERRHGILARARPFKDVAAVVDFSADVSGLAGDADRPFDLVVIRLEFVIVEGPVFDSRSLRNAGSAIASNRFAANLEVPRVEPPALRPVMNRRSANRVHHGMGALHGRGRGVRTESGTFGCRLLRARRPGPAA